MESWYDVAVIGGGPAGAAAAITLARAGRRVVVVDKARFPRDKCCGDGLTTAALRRLEGLGLRPADLPSWTVVHSCVLRSPSGRTVRLGLDHGPGQYAAVARRLELDAALVEVARAAGAEICDGHALVGAVAAPEQDAMVVTVEGVGDVLCRYVVGADGMWSPLRKALGLGGEGYLGEWHAFRQYFVGVTPAAGAFWVWFDADLLPGYAWSFPLPGGRANVGFGLPRGGRGDGAPMGRRLKELWPDLLARPHIAEVLGAHARPEGSHKAWPIPAAVDTAVLAACGGRALFVGDAARASDPLTGEGIGQALETAELAARSILAAGALQPERAGALYTRGVRRSLAVDNRLASVLSRALAHRKGARAAVRVAGSTAWVRRNFSRWLFEDYPRAVVATPWRWHRGMLAGPGAYTGA